MTTNSGNTVNKRPTFLKVLCILSFIACGMMMLFDLFAIVVSLITGSRSVAQMDKNSAMDQVMFFIANSGEAHVKALIGEIFSLAGVILMWRLKKMGFIFYLIGESFVYFEFIYFVVTSSPDFNSVMGVAIEMLWPFPFDLAFFIMYATQLKFMRWNFRAATSG
jgi:hypothetical protein